MMTENTEDNEPLQYLVDLYQDFPDHPLPDWATGINKNKEWMLIGAQLCTKDGRELDNAYIDAITYNVRLKQNIAICITDIGNVLEFTEGELRGLFFRPFFIMDLEKARAKRKQSKL